MNFFGRACNLSEVLINPHTLIEIVTIGILVLLVLLGIKIFKETKKLSHTIFIILGTCLGMFFVWVIVMFIIWLQFGLDDNPPSENYHPLNAIIKYR